jgi:hypothetical protein
VVTGEVAPRDLRGVVLHDVDLTDVSGLSDASLDYAVFESVHLENASLTGSSMRFATFSGTTSLQGVVARHASFEGAVCNGISLQGSDLFHVNICSCDLRNTDLRGALLAHAIINMEGTFGFLSLKRRWTKFGGPYQTLADLHPDTRMRLRKHIAVSSEIMDLHHQHPILAPLWYLLANYGRSAGRLGTVALAGWLFFALMYHGLPLPRFLDGTWLGTALQWLAPHFSVSGTRRLLTGSEAMYLSVVTLTTLGYGDIVPAAGDGMARFLVGTEAVSGVILMGAFISILVQNATLSAD